MTTTTTMTTDELSWKVLEHGPIEKLASNLWRVTGSVPGMSLRRTMTIVRRGDGTLLLHSAIAMGEPAMRELEALGRPAIMIVPNAGHRLDAPRYKKRYPAMRVYGPRGGRKKIEEVIRLDGTYDDFPSDEAVRVETLDGVREREGVLLVRSPDGMSVVINDAVMNMDRKRDFLGYVFTTVMGSAPGPRVSRLARLAFVDDQRALRAHLERLADTPDLVRVIVSHEKVAYRADAVRTLRRAATFLRS